MKESTLLSRGGNPLPKGLVGGGKNIEIPYATFTIVHYGGEKKGIWISRFVAKKAATLAWADIMSGNENALS